MNCSGFGTCGCVGDGDWEFSATFQFGSPKGWDLETSVELSDLLNTAQGGDVAGRENLTVDGLLKEQGSSTAEFGKFYFLDCPVRLTRELRAGQLVQITSITREGLSFQDLQSEIEASYPASPIMRTNVWREHVGKADTQVKFDFFFPPTLAGIESGKIEHGGLFGHMVGADEYPATYDLHKTIGVDGLLRSNRGRAFGIDVGGELAGEHTFFVPNDVGPGSAALFLKTFGPFRYDTPNLALWQSRFERFSKVEDSQAQPWELYEGYGYYFKKDYIYWLQNAGGATIPGVDWLAAKIWDSQRITIRGRVSNL